MIGTLAHKIIEEIYEGTETLTVERAVALAEKKFVDLVPEMAAELLSDEKKVEYRRIKNTLLRAVESLVGEINRRGLLVKGRERELSGTFQGFPFIGYSDIYLEDADGKPFVIDMKWSESLSHYKDNFEKDRALQLATYSWLIDEKNLQVHCAYFLFPKQKLLYDTQHQKWKELWENAEGTWKHRLASIHKGMLEIGTDDEKEVENLDFALKLPAACSFCNYAALCGMLQKKEEAAE